MSHSKPATLSNQQIRYLKKLAHHKKCVVTIGNAGLTDAVLDEIDSSLAHHELLKIRINADDKSARNAMADSICQRLSANLVNSIGHVIAIYRAAEKPILQLPKA